MELFDRLPLILDGATGTELQKKGYTPGCSMEQWVVESAERLKELHKGYVQVGSDVVYAATFGTNRIALEKHGLGDKVREFNLRLAELTQKAVEGKALVGGDIAPTGKTLEPYGDMPEDRLFEVYVEQAGALEEAGVDLFAVETQMSGREAEIAVSAIKSLSKKPIFLSFTCNAVGRTLYGEKVTDLLESAQEWGVSAFGINCCGDFALLERLVCEMSAISKIPLLVKPNAGIPKFVDGKPLFSLAPAEFGLRMAELNSLGASVLGGCCGTGQQHISALVESLKA